MPHKWRPRGGKRINKKIEVRKKSFIQKNQNQHRKTSVAKISEEGKELGLEDPSECQFKRHIKLAWTEESECQPSSSLDVLNFSSGKQHFSHCSWQRRPRYSVTILYSPGNFGFKTRVAKLHAIGKKIIEFS